MTNTTATQRNESRILCRQIDPDNDIDSALRVYYDAQDATKGAPGNQELAAKRDAAYAEYNAKLQDAANKFDVAQKQFTDRYLGPNGTVLPHVAEKIGASASASNIQVKLSKLSLELTVPHSQANRATQVKQDVVSALKNNNLVHDADVADFELAFEKPLPQTLGKEPVRATTRRDPNASCVQLCCLAAKHMAEFQKANNVNTAYEFRADRWPKTGATTLGPVALGSVLQTSTPSEDISSDASKVVVAFDVEGDKLLDLANLNLP